MEKHIYTASSKIEAINEAKKSLVETEKNLIITEDDTSGGLDADYIRQKIEETFNID